MGNKKEYPITVRLEEREYQYISHLAATDDRSLSVLARYLIRRGMDQHRKDGKLFEPPGIAEDPKETGVQQGAKKYTAKGTKNGTLG